MKSQNRNHFFDGVENRVLLSSFAQQLRLKNADVPNIDFVFIDPAGTSPSLVLNQNAVAKEKERKK